MEPIVPIGAQLGAQDTPSVIKGAQDTPSVIQRARPVVSKEQTSSLLQDTAPCRSALYGTPAVYSTPAVRCHACYVSKAFLPNGLYGQGNQFPLMPNPNWMSVREQMLQHQLLQERQQFEAWRASQAQPQPQPPISSSGLPIKVEDDVEIFSRSF